MVENNICDIVRITTALNGFIQEFIYYNGIGDTDAARDYENLAESTVQDLRNIARRDKGELRSDIVSYLQSNTKTREALGMNLGDNSK